MPAPSASAPSGDAKAHPPDSVWSPLVHHLPVPVRHPFRAAVVVRDEQLSALRVVAGGATWATRALPGDDDLPLVPDRHGSAGLPISARGRTRLAELAIQLLTQAGAATETECRRIVADAKARSMAIVDNAHAEVARITSWLEPELEQAPVPSPRGDRPASEAGAAASLTSPAEPMIAAARRLANEPLPAAPTAITVPPGNPSAAVTTSSELVSPDLVSAVAGPTGGAETGFQGPIGDMADPESEVGNEFFQFAPTPDEDAWSFLDDDDLVGVAPSFFKLMRRRPPTRPPTGS